MGRPWAAISESSGIIDPAIKRPPAAMERISFLLEISSAMNMSSL
jgi:hypothetical protein